MGIIATLRRRSGNHKPQVRGCAFHLYSYHTNPHNKGPKEAPTTNAAAENLGTDEKQAPQTTLEDHVDSAPPHQDNNAVPTESHGMDEYDERATKLWSVYM